MSRRMIYGAALVVMASLIGVSWHQSTALAREEDKPLFARLIGPHTLIFQHAQMNDLMKMPALEAIFKQLPDVKEEMEKEFRKELGFSLNDLDTYTMYVDLPRMGNGSVEEPRPPYFMLKTKQPIDVAALKQSVGQESKSIQFGKYQMALGSRKGVTLLDDRTVLVFNFNGKHSAENAQRDLLIYFACLEAGTEVPAGLKTSVDLAISKKHQSVTGFNIPKELSEMAMEQLKQLPPMMAPFKPLALLQSGVATTDYTPGAEFDYTMKLRGRYPDPDMAKAASGAVRLALAAGKMGLSSLPNRDQAEMKQVIEFAQKQLDMIKVDLNESEVIIDYQMNMQSMMPLLLSAIEKVRNAADRMLSASNMRQCLIAMHNYHSDYNKMPEVMTMKDGKPLHSWRVAILPYIEQDNIFKQVKMDEPWDSESNKKLFESVPMPKMYAHPGKKDSDTKMTYYKVFYSKAGAQPRAGFLLGRPATLGQITVQDGTSNTMAMIEVGPPVLWYKPDDIEFDPKAQLPNMISPWKDKKVQVAFFDGSVRSAWLGTDEETWKGFITVNGGETVDFSKIEENK